MLRRRGRKRPRCAPRRPRCRARLLAPQAAARPEVRRQAGRPSASWTKPLARRKRERFRLPHETLPTPRLPTADPPVSGKHYGSKVRLASRGATGGVILRSGHNVNKAWNVMSDLLAPFGSSSCVYGAEGSSHPGAASKNTTAGVPRADLTGKLCYTGAPTIIDTLLCLFPNEGEPFPRCRDHLRRSPSTRTPSAPAALGRAWRHSLPSSSSNCSRALRSATSPGRCSDATTPGANAACT